MFPSCLVAPPSLPSPPPRPTFPLFFAPAWTPTKSCILLFFVSATFPCSPNSLCSLPPLWLLLRGPLQQGKSCDHSFTLLRRLALLSRPPLIDFPTLFPSGHRFLPVRLSFLPNSSFLPPPTVGRLTLFTVSDSWKRHPDRGRAVRPGDCLLFSTEVPIPAPQVFSTGRFLFSQGLSGCVNGDFFFVCGGCLGLPLFFPFSFFPIFSRCRCVFDHPKVFFSVLTLPVYGSFFFLVSQGA